MNNITKTILLVLLFSVAILGMSAMTEPTQASYSGSNTERVAAYNNDLDGNNIQRELRKKERAIESHVKWMGIVLGEYYLGWDQLHLLPKEGMDRYKQYMGDSAITDIEGLKRVKQQAEMIRIAKQTKIDNRRAQERAEILALAMYRNNVTSAAQLKYLPADVQREIMFDLAGIR